MSESKHIKECECDVEDHVLPLSDQECEQEMNDDPDEAAVREQDAHTRVYEYALLEFIETIAGMNSSEGGPLVEKWSKKNHPKLCCEKRHKNRSLMIDEA